MYGLTASRRDFDTMGELPISEFRYYLWLVEFYVTVLSDWKNGDAVYSTTQFILKNGDAAYSTAQFIHPYITKKLHNDDQKHRVIALSWNPVLPWSITHCCTSLTIIQDAKTVFLRCNVLVTLKSSQMLEEMPEGWLLKSYHFKILRRLLSLAFLFVT